MKRKTVAKRGRGGPSSNTPTFFNEEAERIMNQSLASKDGIRERGLDTTIGVFINLIQARNWGKFTTQPEVAMMPLVREFYANAREQLKANPHELRAMVRGRMVAYDHSAINMVFELPDYEEDEYTAWLRSDVDHKAVIDRLTNTKGRWKMTNNRFTSFPRAYLTAFSKAWHYFISARLLPSNHVSDVTRERALLNYAIQTGLAIDVGRIIEQSIISVIIGRLTGSLSHPSLICQLCLKVGIAPTGIEDLLHPLPLINDLVIEGFEKSAIGSCLRPPTASTSSTVPSSSRHDTRRKEKGKAPTNEELSERIDNVDLRVKRMMRRQMQQYEHMVQLFHSCNIPHGDLPQGPTFSDISDDTEEDVDDEASE